MVEFSTILQFIQATGIIVGVAYYILNIQNNQRNQEISQRNQELTLQSQELSRKAQEQQLETRQAQLFMDMYREFVTESESGTIYLLLNMKYTDYEDFERKYGHDENPEANNMITRHMMLMEGFGVLIREGYISVRLVALLTSGTIRLGWEKMRDYIYEVRKRNNMPRWSIEYEYLYNKVMEYAEQLPEQ
jgi:hypothetical protein